MDELLQGAVLEKTASFTVALDKAREKLVKFQLPDPRFYILQILQALIASGADDIVVTTVEGALTGYKLEIRFNGPGYTDQELRNLYDFLFDSGRTRARDRTRELALGVVSCQALKPSSLAISSNGFRWQQVLGKESVSPDPTGLQAFVVEGGGSPLELRLLETHCHNCNVSLVVNRKLVASQGRTVRGSCPWPNYRFQHGDFAGSLGIAYGDIKASSLTLLRHGVQFTKRFEARIRPSMVIECEHQHLRKNASQSDVVEDRLYMEFLEQFSHVQMEFSLQLALERVPAYHRDLVQKYLMRYFGDWFSPVLLTQDLTALEPRMQRMVNLALFTDIYGRRHGLAELIAAYRLDNCLLYTAKRRPYVRVKEVLVLCPTPEEQEVLETLFDRLVNCDEGMESRVAGLLARRCGGEIERPKSLLSRSLEKGELMIPDELPGEAVRWFWATSAGAYDFRTLAIGGLSAVFLSAQSPRDADDGACQALARELQPEFGPLYGDLREKLCKAKLKPQFLRTIARARDHVAQYLLHTLRASHLTPPEILGERWWTSRFLHTRGGQTVSLADVSTWLAVYEKVAVVHGGPPLDDDHALQSSPLLTLALQACFTHERVVEATVEKQLLHLRRTQGALPGAADGPPLAFVGEETEEQEEQRLKRELEEFRRPAPRLAPPAPPPPPAPAPEPAAPAPAQEPATPPLQVPVAPEYADVDLEGSRVSRSEQSEFLQEFEKLSGCSVEVHLETVTGALKILEDRGARQLPPGTLVRFEGGRLHSRVSLEPLALVGWVQSALTAEELKTALRPHLVGLYLRILPLLWQLQPEGAPAAHWRAHLLGAMGVLEELASHPQCREAPLVPLADGRLASVEQVVKVARQLTYTPVCLADDPDPLLRHPVVRMLWPMTVEGLTAVIGIPAQRVRIDRAFKPADQLLLDVRALLRRHGDSQRTGLDERLVGAVAWGQPTRWLGGPKKYFVIHYPQSGLTELNPGHSMLKKIIKSSRWHSKMAPVLASSVFTAINRALDEIEDSHELAFLESLLDD